MGGRRAGHAPALATLRAGDGLWLLGPLGNGFTAAPGPLLVGGGIGIVPLACWQDTVGGLALLGFRDERHAEAAELMSGEVELATDDGSAGHAGFVTELLASALDRDPAVDRLRLRPAADARGRARAVRRARRARPARARVGHGLRVRGLLRLRRAHALGLRAPVRRRPGAGGGRAGGRSA